MMKDFQARLKHHMDNGATYLEALHLLKSTENKQQPSVNRKTLEQRDKDYDKHTS